MRHEDRVSREAWIHGVPWDFSGHVWLSKPDYMVEVQPRTSDVDDEYEDDEEIHSFFVPIDTHITVIACEVWWSGHHLHLAY